MTTQLPNKLPLISIKAQRFILPGRHTWQKFKVIESLMKEIPGVRLFYLDGCVELMTISPEHEIIKSILGALLIIYFSEMDISFIPTGSATLQGEEKGSSTEPDLSYCFGEEIDTPDLAIEIVMTSGGEGKLERYKRFGVSEVWFWKDNQFSLHNFRGENYEKITRSEFLPDLDLAMLAECIQLSSKKEAVKIFRKAIQS